MWKYLDGIIIGIFLGIVLVFLTRHYRYELLEFVDPILSNICIDVAKNIELLVMIILHMIGIIIGVLFGFILCVALGDQYHKISVQNVYADIMEKVIDSDKNL